MSVDVNPKIKKRILPNSADAKPEYFTTCLKIILVIKGINIPNPSVIIEMVKAKVTTDLDHKLRPMQDAKRPKNEILHARIIVLISPKAPLTLGIKKLPKIKATQFQAYKRP